jgi:hypothetical protein
VGGNGKALTSKEIQSNAAVLEGTLWCDIPSEARKKEGAS